MPSRKTRDELTGCFILESRGATEPEARARAGIEVKPRHTTGYSRNEHRQRLA